MKRLLQWLREVPGLKSAVLALLVLCLFPLAARADIWGFVDSKGVAHFASERLDERYELFFRGDERFDTSRGVSPVAHTPRAVAVPTAPPKLLAFFEVSPRHGIDYDLLQALIATESGFDARAVSPKGAVGLMQLIPATAERYGVSGDAKTPVQQKLTDPRTNIRAGSRYLRDLINMFPGQLELALAAYNAGEGAVQRAGNRIPNYKETQNYVRTVMQLYTMLKPPEVLAERRSPTRVRMQMAAPIGGVYGASAPVGGAVGRGNMIAPLAPVAVAPAQAEFKIERD
jgi:hypothetical protein